jgi:hypothetical protein
VRIRVVCEGAYVRATLETAHETRELDALAYVIGDDVVTTARRLLQSANSCSHATGVINVRGEHS